MMRSRSALLSVCSAMVALVPLFGMAQDDYAIVRSRVVNEASAHLLRPVFVNATGTRELQRYFNCTSHEDRDKGMELLERWASAKNTGAYTQLVTDPEADRQVYEGDWVQNQVTVEMQSTPSMIIQSLVKLIDMGATSTNALAALQAASYLISRDNQILDLFNFETGEGDNLTLVWYNLEPDSQTMCMETISDAQLVSTFASGWTYADRSWKEAENGSATFAVHFQKVAWNAWTGNTLNTYNTIDYQNYGRDGEGRSKNWEHIKIADMTNALSYLFTDTNSDDDFHVIGVSVANERNGSFSISQTSVKQVSEQATAGTLYGQQVIGPHDLQSGTNDSKFAIFQHFDTTELASLSVGTPSGYKLVDMVQSMEGNGLFERKYSYEKVTWRAWTTNLAADITDYGNPGPDSHRERTSKTWMDIRNVDLSTAVQALRLGTGNYAADGGSVITDVSVRNNGNGSVTLSQAQTEQVTATNANLTAIDKPGLWPGIRTETTVTYEHFSLSSLPSGTDPSTTNDCISNVRTGPDGMGLFGRVNTFRTAVWANTWAINKIQSGEGNPGGFRKSQHHIVSGVDDANPTSLLASAGTADTGYVISDARVSEGPDGSLSATRAQQISYSGATANDASVVQYQSEFGDKDRVIQREWRRRTTTAKNALVASNGVAVTDWVTTFPGDSTTTTNYYVSVRASDNGDGTWDVAQTLENPYITWNYDSSDIWSRDVTNYNYQTRSVDNQKRKTTYATRYRARASYNSAVGKIEAATGKVVYGSDRVTKIGTHTWLATWDEYIKIDDWLNSPGEP